jgi:Fe2+ transport system protein FeoA
LTKPFSLIILNLNLSPLKPLAHLLPGERAYIVDMRNSHFCQKLFELGVFPGDMVEVKENSGDNQSIIVKINNNTFNIFKGAAETIITHVVSFEFCLN